MSLGWLRRSRRLLQGRFWHQGPTQRRLGELSDPARFEGRYHVAGGLGGVVRVFPRHLFKLTSGGTLVSSCRCLESPSTLTTTYSWGCSTRRAMSTHRPARSTAWRAVLGEMSEGSYSAFGLRTTSRASSLDRAAPSGPEALSRSTAWLCASPADRFPVRMAVTTSPALIPA